MFRDIKRDAFHRSHPLVPAMNASTRPPSPVSPSPSSPLFCLPLAPSPTTSEKRNEEARGREGERNREGDK